MVTGKGDAAGQRIGGTDEVCGVLRGGDEVALEIDGPCDARWVVDEVGVLVEEGL